MSSPQPLPSGTVVPGDDDELFARFLGEVARAELDAWLPPEPCLILDLSLRCPRLVGLMLARGHTVVHADPEAVRPDVPDADITGAVPPGRLLTVRGEARSLDWLADASVDAIVAEGGMLSAALAAEVTVADLHRVLKPGGRLLLCVDSLVSGLARLADQGCWAELADVPVADVVLVPEEDGHISRCFWPEELHGMLSDAGFRVEWVRPRTVLAEETVVRALRVDASQLDSLVTTEMALSERRQGESIGARLVASAVRG